MFYLAPGFKRYFTFCVQADLDDNTDQHNQLICEQIELNTKSEIDIEDKSKWSHEPRVTFFHDTTSTKKNMQIRGR